MEPKDQKPSSSLIELVRFMFKPQHSALVVFGSVVNALLVAWLATKLIPKPPTAPNTTLVAITGEQIFTAEVDEGTAKRVSAGYARWHARSVPMLGAGRRLTNVVVQVPHEGAIQLKSDPVMAAAVREALAGDPDTTLALQRGWVVSYIPSKMKVGDPSRVEVRVSYVDQIGLTADLPQGREVEKRTAELSPEMDAQLFGPKFKITSVGNPQDGQPVDETGVTGWAWDVTPKTWGKQKLEVFLHPRVKKGSVDKKKRVPAYWRVVEVDVNYIHTVLTFTTAYWQWLATTAFIPLGIWGAKAWWRYRKNSDRVEQFKRLPTTTQKRHPELDPRNAEVKKPQRVATKPTAPVEEKTELAETREDSPAE